MQRADPILIFDLDGTVLRVNSFPIWVAYLACGGASHLPLTQRAAVSARVIQLLYQRKSGRVDHETLLREMQAVWRAVCDQNGDRMVRRLQSILLRQARRPLQPAVRLVADGVLDGVLATAAAEDYARGLGEQFGFTDVLATRSNRGPGELSNSGVRKRDRVFSWLDEHGWRGRPLIFFNDDLADMPLMSESNVVCWFGRRRGFLQAKNAAPNVRFVNCRGLKEPEMRSTLAHLCQSVTLARLQLQASPLRASTFA